MKNFEDFLVASTFLFCDWVYLSLVSRASSSIEATGAVLDESDGEGEDVESWNTWDKGHFCSGCSHSDYAHASCGATPHCMARLAFL